MGLTTDLIPWHTFAYDKGLGVSNRPGLGQGCSCSTSQLASAELPKPRQLFPQVLASASNEGGWILMTPKICQRQIGDCKAPWFQSQETWGCTPASVSVSYLSLGRCLPSLSTPFYTSGRGWEPALLTVALWRSSEIIEAGPWNTINSQDYDNVGFDGLCHQHAWQFLTPITVNRHSHQLLHTYPRTAVSLIRRQGEPSYPFTSYMLLS